MKENFICYYWRGHAPLWKIFWIYGVLGSTVLTLILAFPEGLSSVNREYYALVLLFIAAYTAWVVVSIWRCAYNVGRRYWGDLARLMVVFWAINFTLLGLFLTLDYLS